METTARIDRARDLVVVAPRLSVTVTCTEYRPELAGVPDT